MKLSTLTKTFPAHAPLKDINIHFRDYLPPSYTPGVGTIKSQFDFLGMDITFSILMSNMGRYIEGIEIPLDLSFVILKKDKIKLPLPVCGNRKHFPCGAEKCGPFALHCE